MSEIKYVTLPLDDETAESLRAGDIVRLSGKILVGRDAAHKRIVEAIKSGAESPVPIKDEVIYYAGPAPTPPGAVIGPIGPTTSGRMDPYAPLLIEKGLRGMIGKGKRTQAVLDAMKEHKAVYFGATGGTAVLLADCVKSAESDSLRGPRPRSGASPRSQGHAADRHSRLPRRQPLRNRPGRGAEADIERP